jgi:hypothetical protein
MKLSANSAMGGGADFSFSSNRPSWAFWPHCLARGLSLGPRLHGVLQQARARSAPAKGDAPALSGYGKALGGDISSLV